MIMFFTKKTKTSGLTQEIRVRRCYGCGAILQDQDPSEIGYVPPEKFESGEETLCVRCFKLRHYSSYKKSPDFNLDYVTILNAAKAEDALIVYVLNAFNLCGSFLDGLGAYLPSNVIVVINKRDVLPEGYSDSYLVDYAMAHLAQEKIVPKDILITSSSSSNARHISDVMKAITHFRNGKSVYFIGAYQVGKSSLINCLLKDYSNSTEKMITTSPYPGTTLDVISIPLDENSFLYDTPGIYNSKSIISFLEPQIAQYVIPRNEIRPERYSAKDGQSFLFANFARFDFRSGEKTDFTFVKSNDVPILRVKLAKADAAFSELCQNTANDVRTGKVASIDDLVKTEFHVTTTSTCRIRIVGLGFVEFIGNGQTLDVYAPKDIQILFEDDATLKKVS
jgi:30S ribosome assembly GTPase